MKECTRLLSNVSNSINQIAHRINATGEAYGTDLNDIKARQDEIWEAHREVLRKINKLLDAVE